MPESWNGFAISEHVIRIIPKSESHITASYIFAILRSYFLRQQLKMGVFGSVIDEITPEFIASLKIPIFPENEANRVVSLLSDFNKHREKSMSKLVKAESLISEMLSFS